MFKQKEGLLRKAFIVFLINIFIFANTQGSFAAQVYVEHKNMETSTLAPNLRMTMDTLRMVFNSFMNPSKEIKIRNLNISCGVLSDLVKEIQATETGCIITNKNGDTLNVDAIQYGDFDLLQVGDIRYVVRDTSQTVDLAQINPLANTAYQQFFGIDINAISPEQLGFALPVAEAKEKNSVDMFPVRGQTADTVLASAREFVLKAQGMVDAGSSLNRRLINELLNNILIIGLNGSWEDYYLAKDVLEKYREVKHFSDYKNIMVNMMNGLFFSYVSCDWRKVEEYSRIILQGEKSVSGRTKTMFELPIENARLPVNNTVDYEVESIKILGEEELEHMATDDSREEFRLGQSAVEQGRIVSIPFCGGSATTVKNLIGEHKLVHQAIKVRVKKADGTEEIRYISVTDARLGLLRAQNPNAQIAMVTSVSEPGGVDSDKSIRQAISKRYPGALADGRISISMQRAQTVLNNKTGYPMRFDSGYTAACAENHMWALLAVLMNKEAMINYLKNSDGIFSIGNGDNILNIVKEGMVGAILKAREQGRALATVPLAALSAGDRKGGVMVEVTYRHKDRHSEKIVQKEIREISEFPTRPGSGFSGVTIDAEKELEAFQYFEQKGWFIEDLFGNTAKAFNVAFYAIDGRLIISRIFGFDENSAGFIEQLEKISADEWINRILDIVYEVQTTVKPSKGVPNENGTDTVKGRIIENAVQDFIVNGLALLAKEGKPNLEAEMLIADRKDIFLPYKGTAQQRLDKKGEPILGTNVYDLIANQDRIAGVIEEMAAQGQLADLGNGEQVLEAIPIYNLDEIMIASSDEGLTPSDISEDMVIRHSLARLAKHTQSTSAKILKSFGLIPDNKENAKKNLLSIRDAAKSLKEEIETMAYHRVIYDTIDNVLRPKYKLDGILINIETTSQLIVERMDSEGFNYAEAMLRLSEALGELSVFAHDFLEASSQELILGEVAPNKTAIDITRMVLNGRAPVDQQEPGKANVEALDSVNMVLQAI
ncbi:MAG: hypothetical protein ABII88_00195 [Candidatus Omnitrophota bacterium]